MIDFLNSILALVVSFLDLGFLNLWFFPMIALSFVAFVPIFIKSLFTWR